METTTTRITLYQRPPPRFKSRRRCVYHSTPWPPNTGKVLQKRDTDEPDLERAVREYADGAYHANITPTESGFWVEAKDLRVGDVFIGVNGELSVLIDIDRVELDEAILVYNFAVEGNHNYFVIAAGDEYGQTSVLVHNQGGGEVQIGPRRTPVSEIFGIEMPRLPNNTIKLISELPFGDKMLEATEDAQAQYLTIEGILEELLKLGEREAQKRSQQAPEIRPDSPEYQNRPWIVPPKQANIEARYTTIDGKPAVEFIFTMPTGGKPSDRLDALRQRFRLFR